MYHQKAAHKKGDEAAACFWDYHVILVEQQKLKHTNINDKNTKTCNTTTRVYDVDCSLEDDDLEKEMLSQSSFPCGLGYYLSQTFPYVVNNNCSSNVLEDDDEGGEKGSDLEPFFPKFRYVFFSIIFSYTNNCLFLFCCNVN